MKWIFQFPIDPKVHHKWLENCYPKDKFNIGTRSICLIYFSMSPFINYIKFPLWNLNINNLMLVNFHISLLTKQFLRSFYRHRDKTVTLSKLLPNIDKFRNEILILFQKVSRLLNCSSYWDTCLESNYFFQKMPSTECAPFFFFNGSQNWVYLPIFFRPWLIFRVFKLSFCEFMTMFSFLLHKSILKC